MSQVSLSTKYSIDSASMSVLLESVKVPIIVTELIKEDGEEKKIYVAK